LEDIIEFARQFVKLIEAGDIDTVRACYAEDAEIWHNFDQVEQTVDENMKVLEWMKQKSSSRKYEISRLERIRGGYVQQHILRIVTLAGDEIEMPACLIVALKDGKITRLEEYLDPKQAEALRS
jgi:ketosteroid isomerase-like protein